MEVSRIENLPPPPGIINSIKTGFDLIAGNVTTILFPLLLNLFLWLGPRLQMDALFNSIKPDMISTWRAIGVPAAEIQQMVHGYETNLPSLNLFSLAFTIPVGVSNYFINLRFLRFIFPRVFDKLPSAQAVGQTPLGDPLVWQVDVWNIFGITLLLVLLGWVFGGLYFWSVARLAVAEDSQAPGVFHAILQTIFLSISWGMFSLFVGFPFLFILTAVLRSAGVFAGKLIVLSLGIALMWVIVPLYFWSHGVFIKKQNVISSMLSSLQMARFTLPTSSMFVLTVFLLTFGLGYLWSIPPEDSWMMLIGILGHSFIATALLASSFVYYRDVNAWLPRMIEYLKSNLPSRVS
ncbi:MAG: hypothetical protein HY865_24150 [Chloroflexi bacterium]|nr:hypothetical protein [Chloroflexota bacterium]